MGTLTRLALAILVTMSLWISMNMPVKRVILTNITPNVLRQYPSAPTTMQHWQLHTEVSGLE